MPRLTDARPKVTKTGPASSHPDLATRQLQTAKNTVVGEKERLPRYPPDIPRRDPAGHTVHVIAIDPGGKDGNEDGGHVGLTFARTLDDAPGWEVLHVCELTPPELIKWLTVVIGMELVDEIVLERFIIKKMSVVNLIGSELPTVQLIGWIKTHVGLMSDRGAYSTNINLQLPEERFVADGLTESQGIGYMSPKTPDHARSSEMHLWTWLFNSGLVKGKNGKPVVIR